MKSRISRLKYPYAIVPPIVRIGRRSLSVSTELGESFVLEGTHKALIPIESPSSVRIGERHHESLRRIPNAGEAFVSNVYIESYKGQIRIGRVCSKSASV